MKKFEDIKNIFSYLQTNEEKFEYIIELGKSLPDYDNIKSEENLITGCMSSVWLKKDIKNGKISLKSTSDTIIIKGFLHLISSIFNGLTQEQANNIDFSDKLKEIGLENAISSQRLNGISSIINKIQKG